jgi:hypothetical protein
VTIPNLDPLVRYLAAANVERNLRPVPLVATKIQAEIQGGLAIVTTERRFRNAESLPIEAVITFPVPVDAVLVGLRARIGERTVKSRARRREDAREKYEDALDRGKAAVLHEEILRGVHMLSVGQLPGGAEVTVVSTWVTFLANHAEGAQLRIPTTVGDIYGISPLADSDDLMHADIEHKAELEITCGQGEVQLGDGVLASGRARVPLNRPIDLTVTGWQPRVFSGVAADGRSVRLDIRPAKTGMAPIDAELVVDRSGSMGERCADGDAITTTKFSVLCDGLRRLARSLRPADRVRLWEFADAATCLGGAQGPGLEDLVDQLTPPNGGTEIGQALAAAAARSEAGDIVFVTDGKSHALDVHALSRTGKRFTVVLVGEDSLEANVGHLAGVSGGQLFVVVGADAAEAVFAAFESIRSSHVVPSSVEGIPTKIALRRRGMAVEAEWSGPRVPDAPAADCIGAVAAALALPLLPEEKAAALAEAHGLGSHLTSLVLVDEEGEPQLGLPAMRQVPQSTPRTAMFREHSADSIDFAANMDPLGADKFPRFSLREGAPPLWRADRYWLAEHLEDLARETRERLGELKALAAHIDDLARQAHEQVVRASEQFSALADQIDDLARRVHERAVRTSVQFETLAGQVHDLARRAREQAASGALNFQWLVGRIDWSRDPERLRRADLLAVNLDVAEGIRSAAQQTAVIALAEQTGESPLSVVVALLAHADQHRNRNAARLFRAVLGGAAAPAVAAAAAALGL